MRRSQGKIRRKRVIGREEAGEEEEDGRRRKKSEN